MDDSIGRQDIIDMAYGCEDEFGKDVVFRFVDYIRQLPSAKPEQQWIPCRNHLPSLRDEIYLVSLAWGGVGTMEFKDTGWHNYGSLSPVPIETVTAWMPLPEAYKGEKK